VAGAVLGALVLPVALDSLTHRHTVHSEVVTGVLIIALSVLNVEIGRVLEGGASKSQRPHKGLSGWAFATALLLPTWWLLPVVGVTYAHAWWRGLRVPPWKWTGSAAYVVLAASAASVTGGRLLGSETDLMHGTGGTGLLAVAVAAATFLVVETVLFHGSAYLNRPEDEVWLRQTLRTPSFYLTEGAVLLVGGLSAAIWTGGGWFVLLLAPVYVMTQRAALHEPLRERADRDGKTGVLRFEAWRGSAVAAAARCHRARRPWGVLFADLDHFKSFNDTWGHLKGDDALVAVAHAITSELRTGDLLGRFGGEEFCIFLHDLRPDDARAVAERIRAAVAGIRLQGGADGADSADSAGVTISVGLAMAAPGDDAAHFADVLRAADRALFRAKEAGRDRVAVELTGSARAA
jgi:diguanylate cyclase (GGDEF)-like protein